MIGSTPRTDAVYRAHITFPHKSIEARSGLLAACTLAVALERENVKLRAALEYIATGGEDWKDCARTARATLGGGAA